jgi:hypothetical protein
VEVQQLGAPGHRAICEACGKHIEKSAAEKLARRLSGHLKPVCNFRPVHGCNGRMLRNAHDAADGHCIHMTHMQCVLVPCCILALKNAFL